MPLSEIDLYRYHEAGFSTHSMRVLESYLKDHPEIHWIQLSEEGIFELILDNHMMSTYRTCPANFMNSFVDGIQPRSGGRSWFLDLGILFHKMVEEYYDTFREGNFDLVEWGVNKACLYWREANMDFHKDQKEYKTIGGMPGFSALCVQYATKFSSENERMRVIGTEIGFGKKREVHLGFVKDFLSLYLSGRIDVLVDDGTHIIPMDHKTKASFRNDPAEEYEVDEGPTGYIFAMNKILPSLIPPELILKRKCDRISMNFISKAPTDDPMARFRRLPIYKTQEQLEAYRQRMLISGENIFRALIKYLEDGYAQRNTSNCKHMFMRDCPFLPIHRQGSKRDELAIINSMYEKKPIWDTETVGKEENAQ